jgi:anti-anti-sigma regulatory factor
MLRLTRIDSAEGPLLKLEGRLAGVECAQEVRAACAEGVTLDLTWVTFVDTEGSAVLAALAREGVRLTNIPLGLSVLREGAHQ